MPHPRKTKTSTLPLRQRKQSVLLKLSQENTENSISVGRCYFLRLVVLQQQSSQKQATSLSVPLAYYCQNLTTQFIFLSFSLAFFFYSDSFYILIIGVLGYHFTWPHSMVLLWGIGPSNRHITRARERHPRTTNPASKRPQTHALVRAATGIGSFLQTDGY